MTARPYTFDPTPDLRETLHNIIGHISAPREDVTYGGVLVDTPDGPRLAWLRLTFEPTGDA